MGVTESYQNFKTMGTICLAIVWVIFMFHMLMFLYVHFRMMRAESPETELASFKVATPRENW